MLFFTRFHTFFFQRFPSRRHRRGKIKVSLGFTHDEFSPEYSGKKTKTISETGEKTSWIRNRKQIKISLFVPQQRLITDWRSRYKQCLTESVLISGGFTHDAFRHSSECRSPEFPA